MRTTCYCAAGGDAGAEAGCDVSGAVFVRSAKGDLVTNATSCERARLSGVASSSRAFRKRWTGLRVLRDDRGERARRRLRFPPAVRLHRSVSPLEEPGGGRARPTRVRRPPTNAEHGSRSGAWGDGAAQVGLEQGRGLGAIGAVRVRRRRSRERHRPRSDASPSLRWRKGTRDADPHAISVEGTIADIAIANDGTTYVLESTDSRGRNALVKRFDDAGRELEAIETAERTSSQIRMAQDGPLVLHNRPITGRLCWSTASPPLEEHSFATVARAAGCDLAQRSSSSGTRTSSVWPWSQVRARAGRGR